MASATTCTPLSGPGRRFDHGEHGLGLGVMQGHQLIVVPLAAVQLQDQALKRWLAAESVTTKALAELEGPM